VKYLGYRSPADAPKNEPTSTTSGISLPDFPFLQQHDLPAVVRPSAHVNRPVTAKEAQPFEAGVLRYPLGELAWHEALRGRCRASIRFGS
jgi:hypothetical protein